MKSPEGGEKKTESVWSTFINFLAILNVAKRKASAQRQKRPAFKDAMYVYSVSERCE